MSKSNRRDAAWVVAQPSNADYTSPEITANGCKVIHIQIALSGSSSPGGTFTIQGSDDNSVYFDLYLDANKVYGSTNGSTYSHAGGTTVTVSGSSASKFLIPLENPPAYLRLFFHNTSGGTTGDRLNARWWSRAV